MQKIPTLILCVVAACASASASEPDGAITLLPRPEPADILPTGDSGQWVTRVQLVWDEDTRTLERRSLTVWRNFPGQPLDFLWLPDGDGVPAAGPVDGVGRLLWRKRNTSTADSDAVVSVYQGELVDGKAHGHGTFFHNSGLIYKGTWQQGLMHGQGRLISPFGSVYTGTFSEGRPVGGSRLVNPFGETYVGSYKDDQGNGEQRFIHSDPAAMPWVEHPQRLEPGITAGDQRDQWSAVKVGLRFGSRTPPAQYARFGDMSIGVFVASPMPTEDWMSIIAYQGENSGDTLVVVPEDDALMRAWLGGPDDLDVVHQASIGGAMWSDLQWDGPVELRIAVRNGSTRKQRISGAYLSVEESAPTLNPFVETYFHSTSKGCMGDWNSVSGEVSDNGWGTIADSTFSFQLGTRLDPSATMVDFHVGAVDGSSRELDLTHSFAQMGVNRDLYQAVHSCAAKALGLPRDSGEWDGIEPYQKKYLPKIEQCFKHLQQSGRLGNFSRHLSLHDSEVLLQFVARYSYQWVDHRGKRQNSSRIYPATINLGDLLPVYGCGGAEAGEAEPFLGNRVELKPKGSGYRVRVPLRATIPAGEEKTWSLVVAAPKSSRHRFTIVLNTAGGRLQSHPIDLTVFRPNRERLFDFPKERRPENPNFRWIQMASQNSFEAAKKVACRFQQGLTDVEVYRAMNGWHAIVAGPFSAQEVKGRMASLKQRRAIPADSVVTNGERFVERLKWSPCSQ